MTRNGWWCPDHGFYRLENWYLTRLDGKSYIPIGGVLKYTAPYRIGKESITVFVGIDEDYVDVFAITVFPNSVYYCDARDLKEFEDNLPSGLLFNCPQPE